jgi:hypothetical protein
METGRAIYLAEDIDEYGVENELTIFEVGDQSIVFSISNQDEGENVYNSARVSMTKDQARAIQLWLNVVL